MGTLIPAQWGRSRGPQRQASGPSLERAGVQPRLPQVSRCHISKRETSGSQSLQTTSPPAWSAPISPAWCQSGWDMLGHVSGMDLEVHTESPG